MIAAPLIQTVIEIAKAGSVCIEAARAVHDCCPNRAALMTCPAVYAWWSAPVIASERCGSRWGPRSAAVAGPEGE